MTAPAPTTGPTPNNMPGAGPAASGQGAENTSGNPAEGDDDGDEGEGQLTFEELKAKHDNWKTQAQRWEKRSKANAEKAKQFDGEAQEWKKAWEREQAAKNKVRTPEEIKAEADAAANSKILEAETARKEAEANLLRWKLADGKVPAWAMPLVSGTDEDEITEQIEDLKKNLAEYAAAQLPNTDPRRPAPNPLAGRTNQVGTGPREAFANAFGQLLNG